ncbi:MAG: M24 family metallopeptidase [Candidatus Micrarchaeia archaeon]
MDELSARRKKFFAGAPFRAALLYSGDDAGNPNPSFRYFSGCNVDSSYLLLKPSGGRLLTHEMNFGAAKSVSRYPVQLLGKDRAGDIRRACGKGKVGFVLGEASASRFLALRKKAKLNLVEADSSAFRARGAKSQNEIFMLSQSAEIAREILNTLDPWECKTELELLSRLKIMALEAGADISFEPIVATGKNTSFPHHNATGKTLGDSVLVDFGVRYKGYCSDFTRCYFRKQGRELETYDKCQEIFAEILEGLPECKQGKDIALLSAMLFKQRGLPALIHSIGHGIGLEVHEYPHLGRMSEDYLGVGTVLAIEPAAYFKDYGVRYEEMVVCTKKGWKKL